MEITRAPHDISPTDFFTRWIPDAVAADVLRRERLGETRALIVFDLQGEEGGAFTLEIDAGTVTGRHGAAPDSDLRVRIDIATWRKLNSGELSAPEALLKRKLKLEGNFVLGLKLHVILG